MATIDGNQKKLTVSGESIESAVNSKHEHSNSAVLDKLSDNNGILQYNGSDITGGGSTGLTEEQEAQIAKISTIEESINNNTDNIANNAISISSLTTRVTAVENNGVSDEVINQKISNYINTNGVLSDGCIDNSHLSNTLFGNYVNAQNINGSYPLVYLKLDTSKITSAESYAARIKCKAKFNTANSKSGLQYGFGAQYSNNNMMSEGTLFSQSTTFSNTNVYKIDKTATLIDLPICFKVANYSSSGNLSVELKNVEIYINDILVPIVEVGTNIASHTGTIEYNLSIQESPYLATLSDTEKLQENIENVVIDRYNFSEDLQNEEPDNSVKFEYSSGMKGHLIFYYDLGYIEDSPNIKFEFVTDRTENCNFTGLKVHRYGIEFSDNGTSQDIGFVSSVNSVKNKKHTLEYTLPNPARYFAIIFNFSKTDTSLDDIFHVKVSKLYVNGVYCKLSGVKSDSKIISTLEKYSDDRIMNYGNHKETMAETKEYNKKIIRCMGDSTTNGNNGATNELGFPTHLQQYYKNCKVVNNGWNGIDASGFFTTVNSSSITDWNDTIAVLACYGANASGGYDESAIPNLLQYKPNAKNTNNTPVERSVVDAISEVTYAIDGTNNIYNSENNTITLGSKFSNSQNYTVDGVNCIYNSDAATVKLKGFYYNDTWIDNEEKYWNLFGNNWYGKMAKGIEYVQWMNPLTALVLHSYHHLNICTDTQAEDLETYMLKLQDMYRIPVIRANKELGVNSKTIKTYLLDWAHMNDLGNKMKGWYLARQLETYIKVPYIDECYETPFKHTPVASVTMNRTTENVIVGNDIYVYVKVQPFNAENKDIVITTDNENITVTPVVRGLEWQKYKVSGVTSGITVITATSDADNTLTSTCTVTVTE